MRAGRLGGRMERERPEYLQPIPRSRWEFPWLGMWAVLLLGMAGAGIWLHLKTGDAWNTRFKAAPELSGAPARIEPSPADSDSNRKAMIAEIRARRELAEIAAKRAEAGRLDTPTHKDELRCINGIAFRRIPGGWENVPGAPCP